MQVHAAARSSSAHRAAESRKADSGIEDQISELEKRKKELEIKIKSIRGNRDLDKETAKAMTDALQQQIQRITQTIQELRRQQAEQRKQQAQDGGEQKSEGARPVSQRPGDEFVRSGLGAGSMQQAISADQLRNLAASSQSLKTTLSGRANVLESELKLDSSYGIDTSKKMEEIAKLRDGARNVMQAAVEQTAPFTKSTASPIHAGKLLKVPAGDEEEADSEKNSRERELTYDKRGRPVNGGSQESGLLLNRIA